MKIEELKNNIVKLSPRSLTCKSADGKTLGVVTGAESFASLRPNRQIDFFKQIRSAGLWEHGEADKVYILNNRIYYLYDLRTKENYEKYFIDRPGFEKETNKYNLLKQLAENAAAIGTVIPCYITK